MIFLTKLLSKNKYIMFQLLEQNIKKKIRQKMKLIAKNVEIVISNDEKKSNANEKND